jgi:aminoglycoside phosphotransferase (APT) family kinase protein
MHLGDLVGRARLAVASAGADPATHGLTRLAGGMTHHVFAPIEDSHLVVKVFQTHEWDEPEHEWDALVALAGSGIAPEPVHFDAAEPAIVVMTRVPGSPLPADALGVHHARQIGQCHRLVHRTVPQLQRPLSNSGVRAARTALMLDDSDDSPGVDLSDVVRHAWKAAQVWIANADVEHLLSSGSPCFSRGDPNLSNYLWNDEGVVLIDWENSGDSDPALELADMAEHASTRSIGEEFWTELADATELTQTDRARVVEGRRLMSCFWLALIERRQRQGLPTSVTLPDQAFRTLTALDL